MPDREQSHDSTGRAEFGSDWPVLSVASEEVRFEVKDRQQLYGWVEQASGGRDYAHLSNPARGLVRRHMKKMTRPSRAQMTRLIATGSVTRVCRRMAGGQRPIA